MSKFLPIPSFNLGDKVKGFFFAPRSAVPIALFRILFGFFVLQVSLIELLPNFYQFFGLNSVIDLGAIASHWWHPTPIFDAFLLMPQNDTCRLAFFFLFVLFAFFLTIGFKTRLSAIIIYLGLLTLDRQNPFILDGGDDFMRVMSFLLIFSAAGEAYSVDRILKAKGAGLKVAQLPPTLAAPWAQRMIQIQVSLIYLSTFLAKIVGVQWQNGTAVYYASQLVDFSRVSLPWLTTTYPFYLFLTYYTLLVELAMGTLVWFKPFRYPILLMAALFHAGVDLTMNLPCFEWLFVSSYITFIEPQDLHNVLQRLKSFCSRRLPKKQLSEIPNKELPAAIQPEEPPAHQTKISPENRLESPFLLVLTTVLLILLVGAYLAKPIRAKLLVDDRRRDYVMRLSQTEEILNNKWQQLSSLPAQDPQRLKVQEALALILSLRKDYVQAGDLLRGNCQIRIKQHKPYDTELIRAFSTLANIYLETGHLDASELAYRTIWQYDKAQYDKLQNSKTKYDKAQLAYSQNRLSVDLNNLSVVYYFRALLEADKLKRFAQLDQANTFLAQALNNLNLPQNADSSPFCTTAEDILSNQYLVAREQCRFSESRRIKGQLSKLNINHKYPALP